MAARGPAGGDGRQALRWLVGNSRRLLAIEHEFAVRPDDPADRADRVVLVEADAMAGSW
jgi:hypothetical protein